MDVRYRIQDPYRVDPEDENDQVFFCNCIKFKEELIEIARKILSETSEELNWQEFEAFAKQFPSRYPQMVCGVNDVFVVKSCEQELCSELVARKDMLSLKKRGLSTMLLNVISFHLLNECHFYASNFFHYLEMDACFYNDFEILHIFAALDVRSHYMKLLLNFNFVSSLKVDSPRLMVMTIKILRGFIWDDTGGANYRGDRLRKARQIVNLAEDIYFLRSFDQSFTKRILLTTFCIQAIRYKLEKKENRANENIQCLRMYFAATRDPLLTTNEARSMIFAYLNVLENLHLFESYCNEFDMLMPECSAILNPRNLTDLARCQIRESLGKCNLPLPAAVERLTSSQSLSSFILGDVIDMSHKYGISSPEQIITMSHLEGLLFERESIPRA